MVPAFSGCFNVPSTILRCSARIKSGVNGLSWLAYGMNFGLTSPFVLDLGVLTLTFGIAFRLNVAVIIVTLLALVLGIFVSKKV